MRSTGIEVIGDVPWGTHFCQFYDTRQDLVDIVVPYFKAGLQNNECCTWVTSKPLQAQEAKAALALAVDDLDEYFRSGQIEILDYSQCYTAGGTFNADRVLRAWVERLDSATKRGFDGLRLTGNTFWLEQATWRDFAEYEAAVNSVIDRYRMLAMCTYSLTTCGAAEVVDVVSNHQFAIIKRAGNWDIIKSDKYRTTEDELRRARRDLEQKVQQRTADLAATVNSLQTEVEQRQAAQADLRDLNQLVRMVSSCNMALVRIDDEQALMHEICRIILDVGGYRMAWVGYAENDQARSVRPVGYVGIEEGYLETAKITWADTERGRGPTGTAIRLGKVRICDDFLTDPALAPWRDQALKRGFRSSIALPLTAAGKVFGCLTIYASQPAAFTESQAKVLTELADDLAFGITALRTRTALQESRQHLAKVVHSAPLVIWAIDTNGVFTLAEGALVSLGITPQQMVGRHMRDVLGNRPDILEHVARAAKGEAVVAEIEQGTLVFEARYSQLKGADGQTTGVICVSTDITERRRAEREVLAATEQERRRIGRDLHDSIQAGLAGLGFLLAALRQQLNQKDSQFLGEVNSISEVVAGIIEQTRAISRGLCPPQLEFGGLVAALEHLASTMSNLFRIPCRLCCQKTILVQDETTAAQLYYICQEAVNNAIKHAKPRCIEIRVTGQDDFLSLQVQDDGIGLPEDAAPSKGMGLRTMNYRSKVLGARLDIHRAQPHGTVLTCSLRSPHIHVCPKE